MVIITRLDQSELYRRFMPVTDARFQRAKTLAALGLKKDDVNITVETVQNFFMGVVQSASARRFIAKLEQTPAGRRMRYAVFTLYGTVEIYTSLNKARLAFAKRAKEAANGQGDFPRLTTTPAALMELSKHVSDRCVENSQFTYRDVYEYVVLTALFNDEEREEYMRLQELYDNLEQSEESEEEDGDETETD